MLISIPLSPLTAVAKYSEPRGKDLFMKSKHLWVNGYKMNLEMTFYRNTQPLTALWIAAAKGP